MGRDLSYFDVFDLDTGEVDAQDELISVQQAVKLFTKRCPTCDQHTGITYQQILKAIRLGHIPSYNRFGGSRSGKKREQAYVIYSDIKTFDEKQKRIKARRQWDG